jgi:hypothetical protein
MPRRFHAGVCPPVRSPSSADHSPTVSLPARQPPPCTRRRSLRVRQRPPRIVGLHRRDAPSSLFWLVRHGRRRIRETVGKFADARNPRSVAARAAAPVVPVRWRAQRTRKDLSDAAPYGVDGHLGLLQRLELSVRRGEYLAGLGISRVADGRIRLIQSCRWNRRVISDAAARPIRQLRVLGRVATTRADPKHEECESD